ncbi:Tellurium resistance protein TerZ [Seminavis robusta]|uniref:Tellurium resistance protein TerZ n=1 Tax=Seminavis robusta TaxID=568900 RepID=A0A9N8DLZ0_9STRA|nr:Tellurium resistance protein TerZ [Seminavis robusta]|eukprot:Sro152_g069540.1 Tellurium resistance protein TerZ (591) ;mRNA; f:70667-72439
MTSVSGLEVDIHIIEGRNLVAKDRNLMFQKTSSDPFVKIFHGDKRIGKTKVIKKTLNPEWHEQFHLHIDQYDFLNYVGNGANKFNLQNAKIPPIMLYLFDEDKASADDPMGTVAIPLDLLVEPKQQWLKVENGEGKNYCRNAKGEVSVLIKIQAQQVLQLIKGNIHPMKHDQVTVGLAWEPLNQTTQIDLDASCVALSTTGEVLMEHTVYYGNPFNPTECILHTGDETTGDKKGDDESIILNLKYIPDEVLCLYLVLSVVTPNYTLAQIQSTMVRFYYFGGDKEEHGICRMSPSPENTKDTSLILARLSRDHDRLWELSPVEVGTSPARDFGSLIPQIKSLTKDLLPRIKIDPAERVAIMRKDGGVIRIQDFCPAQVLPVTVSFGLAWDVTDGKSIDLDASVICLDADLKEVDIISFRNLKSADGAILHQGDQTTGKAAGDDETIDILLESVSSRCKYIGIIVNSYSGQELDDVARASCRLYDTETRAEIARYALTDSKELDKHTALLMGCLYRSSNGQWLLAIISAPAHGRMAEDNVDELQKWLRRNPPPNAPTVVVQEVPDNDLVSMPDHVPHDTEKETVLVPSTYLQ